MMYGAMIILKAEWHSSLHWSKNLLNNRKTTKFTIPDDNKQQVLPDS